LKIKAKEMCRLKNGNILVMISLIGCRGQKFELMKQELRGKLMFFHEAPQTDIECSYHPKENSVELGGAEKETDRTLYLILDK